jgi:hypothetical protein
VALVVMERSLDMAALLFWGVLAMLWVGRDEPLMLLAAAGTGALLVLLLVLLSPLRRRAADRAGRAAAAGQGRALGRRLRRGVAGGGGVVLERARAGAAVALVSLAIWGGHLAQFWLFAQGLGAVPFLDNMAFATLAILAGPAALHHGGDRHARRGDPVPLRAVSRPRRGGGAGRARDFALPDPGNCRATVHGRLSTQGAKGAARLSLDLANDSERGWRTLLYVLTALAALVYLNNALFEPGTLTFAPYTIQDDARQFLTWMSRLDDAGALQGDLLADYWQSVCPPFYQFIYTAMNAIGAGADPVRAAAAGGASVLLRVDGVADRAVHDEAPGGGVRGRRIRDQLRAARGFDLQRHAARLLHPAVPAVPGRAAAGPRVDHDPGAVPARAALSDDALVGLTMMGLSRIGWRPFRIDLSARSWLLGALGVAAVGLAIVPFAGSTSAWEPTLNLEQALAMPNLGTAEGRSTVVGLTGSVDYLCSARMGLLPEIVPCWSTRIAVLPNLLLMVPMLLLAFRAVRGTRYQPGEEPGDLIHAWALIAAIAWWTVAIAVAFQLHLPSRYTQRTLSVLEFLAIGQLLGPLLERRLKGRRSTWGTMIVGGLFALFFLASFATPTPGLSQPADRQAVDRIAALPAGAVVGGVSDQLDYLPALTGRSTLATIEHSIPYHSGYFTPLRERLEGALAAVSSPDRRCWPIMSADMG